MHCLSLPLIAPIIPHQPSASRSIAMQKLGFQDKSSKPEPVSTDFRSGLRPLVIDTNPSKIEREIDSPTLIDPVTITSSGEQWPSAAADTATQNVGQGWLLGQDSLIDSCDLMVARHRSKAVRLHASPASTLEKWFYLFDQVFIAEKDPRENLENMIQFKASLAALNIDELLVHVRQVAPILGDDQRKSDLLEFHRIFQGKNYFKALFLTAYGLVPAQLENYRYFRKNGCDPDCAATLARNQKSTITLIPSIGSRFLPYPRNFAIL